VTTYEAGAEYDALGGTARWQGVVWADDGTGRTRAYAGGQRHDEAEALADAQGWMREQAQAREAARDAERAAGAGRGPAAAPLLLTLMQVRTGEEMRWSWHLRLADGTRGSNSDVDSSYVRHAAWDDIHPKLPTMADAMEDASAHGWRLPPLAAQPRRVSHCPRVVNKERCHVAIDVRQEPPRAGRDRWSWSARLVRADGPTVRQEGSSADGGGAAVFPTAAEALEAALARFPQAEADAVFHSHPEGRRPPRPEPAPVRARPVPPEGREPLPPEAMDAAAFEAFRAASSARVYHAVIAAAVPGLPAFVDIALEAGRAAARAVEAAYERSMADGSYRRRG
jgi:hypothetical protein